MLDDRLLNLSQRLADKQREVDELRASLAGVSSTRGWRVLTAASLIYRTILLQSDARRQLTAALRRRTRPLADRLRRRPLPSPAAPVHGPAQPGDRYTQWRAAHEPDAIQLAAQRRTAAGWTDAPLISVVVPVFKPPADAFADTVDSVRQQTYGHWQLVLVLAGPQPPEVEAVARAAAAAVARVRLVTLASNLGISANTRAGLEAADGAYLAFLDHDDLLSPQTLFEVARVLRRYPDVDVVTFDEDKVAPDGRTRIDPLFKPAATSPEHMLSSNDRMHSVIRKASVDRSGGLAEGVDGAQDWDMGLRLLEIGARAYHIPRVLYHWRMVPGSAAMDAMAKPWAFDAQRVALGGHLARLGRPAPTVEHPRIGVNRVSWRTSDALVSIVIPTKDRADLLDTCVQSILERTTYPHYEVLIVDTGSAEPATAALYERLVEDPRIRMLRDPGPFNWSRVNNVGAREARGAVLVFLNNDTEVVDPRWLDELVRWTDVAEVGCVGAKLLYPDTTIQHAGVIAGLGGHGSHVYAGSPGEHTWGAFGSVDQYRNYLMLSGACLAVRTTLFQQLGGFDEEYVLCYSDVDLCLKAAEAGHRNVYTPFATLIHHEGKSRGKSVPPGDVLRATIRLYPLVVQGDPFFNPNLSYRELIPAIAVDEGPHTRAAHLWHIVRVFGVEAEMRCAFRDELVGRTSVWRGYERLLAEAAPAVPSRVPARPGGRRLLCVSPDLDRSGATASILPLVGELVRAGHAVTVLVPSDGHLREAIEEDGGDVIVSPVALLAPYVLGDLLSSFDAVLPATIHGWRTGLAAAARGIPVVWLLHGSEDGRALMQGESGALQALTAADAVLLPSMAARARYADLDAGNLFVEDFALESDHPDSVAADPFVSRVSAERLGRAVVAHVDRALAAHAADRAARVHARPVRQ